MTDRTHDMSNTAPNDAMNDAVRDAMNEAPELIRNLATGVPGLDAVIGGGLPAAAGCS